MALSKKAKGILSVIGAVFARIGISIANPLGNYNIYMISYVNHFKPNDPFKLDYGYVIKTFISFFFLCFSPLGGFFNRKLGCHWTMIISTVIQLLATVALLFIKSLISLYASIIFLSIGMGLGYLSPIKNSSFFFPKQKGLVTNLIYGIGGLSSPMFNFIGETIINPDNKVLKFNEKYFDYSINKNLIKYYYVILIGISVSVIISLILIFQYREEDYVGGEGDPLLEVSENNANNEREDISEDPLSNLRQSSTDHWNNIKKRLKTYRVWNLFLITFFANFLPFMITISFKVIGTYERFQIVILKTTTSVMSLVKNGICPFFGYLFDTYGYHPMIKVVNISAIMVGILMCLSTYNEVLFGIITVLNSIIVSGFRCITDPLIMHVFSIAYSIEIGGLVGLSFGLSSLISTAFVFGTSLFQNRNISYFIIFITGAALNWLSLLLSFFEDETRFKFVEDNNSLMISKKVYKEIPPESIKEEEQKLLSQ